MEVTCFCHHGSKKSKSSQYHTWWRHQMETFSALLAICAGNSPVPGEFPAQRPVKRSFDVFFDLCPNKQLSKQSWGWWFEMPSGPLWRHRNVEEERNPNENLIYSIGCHIFLHIIQLELGGVYHIFWWLREICRFRGKLCVLRDYNCFKQWCGKITTI